MAKRLGTARLHSLVQQIVEDILIKFNMSPVAGTDLGSADNRWGNIYCADMHLSNGRGDYQIVEEEEYLSVKNNKTGKLYKFVLEEITEEGE